MNRKNLLSAAAVAALVAGGVFAASGVAYANASYSNYNKVLPLASIDILAGGGPTQVKYTANASGNINVSTVGASYTIRAHIQTLSGNGWTTWTAPLSGGSSASLPNTIPFNADSYLALRVATFNTATVQSTGTWRSN
jgi:hypothetical protein